MAFYTGFTVCLVSSLKWYNLNATDCSSFNVWQIIEEEEEEVEEEEEEEKEEEEMNFKASQSKLQTYRGYAC